MKKLLIELSATASSQWRLQRLASYLSAQSIARRTRLTVDWQDTSWDEGRMYFTAELSQEHCDRLCRYAAALGCELYGLIDGKFIASPTSAVPVPEKILERVCTATETIANIQSNLDEVNREIKRHVLDFASSNGADGSDELQRLSEHRNRIQNALKASAKAFTSIDRLLGVEYRDRNYTGTNA